MFPDLMRDDVFRLETGRLWLRWPRAADAARIAELVSAREVAEQTANIPHPYPPGAAAEFVLDARRRNLSGQALILVVTLKSRPNEVIGAVSLTIEGDEAEIGYWLGQNWWGEGYMSEAVRALIAMAFRHTDLDAIHAKMRVGNARSRQVLEAAGFVPVGPGLCPAPARGGAVPGECFVLTRPAFAGELMAVPAARAQMQTA
jgi:RimJ/RimL family protein N-acetyltransferase